MGNEGARALPLAEGTLLRIAREYGIGAVSYNPGLLGTTTLACLKVQHDGTQRIELQPTLPWPMKVLAILHECGHAVRFNDPETRGEALAIHWYHVLRDRGHRPIPRFEDLARREEAAVTSWAWQKFLDRYGPWIATEEYFEACGLVFEHRES